MLTVMLIQLEFKHPDSCEFAQYVVVVTGDVIINGLPVPNKETLQPVRYHPIAEPVPPDVLKPIVPE